MMLKILRLLFAARIELFNNGCLAPVKTKRTTGAREAVKHNLGIKIMELKIIDCFIVKITTPSEALYSIHVLDLVICQVFVDHYINVCLTLILHHS